MSSCEQELCPFWTGDDGCSCAVFGIPESERRREQRALGIVHPEAAAAADDPDPWDECAECGHDRDEHDPHGCHAELIGGQDCGCAGFEEEAAHRTR
jgi:hypothetical protein